MSGEGEYQNYSEINLNAIKNTKLFQKFMQNKSGLISSGSSAILSNPKTQNQQPQAQDTQVMKQKKWAKNRNANKVTKVLQVQQNPIEKQITNQKQDNIIIPPNNKSEPQVVHIQKPIENNNETVRLRVLEKQQVAEIVPKRPQNHPNNQTQSSNIQRAQQYEPQTTQHNNHPPVPNRRKRNFNPNFQSSRGHPQQLQQRPIAQFQVSNNEANSYGQQQKYVSYVSSVGIKNMSQNVYQNSVNLYNTATVRQQNFTLQDQKQQKTQFQPPRSQYPHSYTFNEPPKPILQPIPSPIPATTTESQYKKKYESLIKRYQQLKHDIKNDNKSRKKQLTQWQHQIDMLKQKLFDVQSRQDSLLIENQRLRQKWQSQNLLKMKTQQENKQLGYKVKELEDQLAMRDNHIKQKADQTNYWKAQADGLKQELHGLRLNFEKRNDEYNLLLGDCQIIKRERDNKDFLLQDLRRNITFLVEENSAAKDQIFKLVTKLYQLQQENQVLRNDIKRQSMDHSQLNNYMKDLQQQSRDRVQSTNDMQRQHERHYDNRNQYHMQKNQNFVLKETIPRNSFPEQEKTVGEKQTRRRGEFARERGQLTRNQRVEREQRPLPTSQNTHNTSNINIPQQRQQTIPKNPQFANNNKVARMTQISQQLQRIRDMKAMNGAIRRKKIQLQRELLELESQ